MATFRHATPGSITTSKRVIVSDALASSTKFTFDRPENSTVEKIIVRCLDAVKIDSGNIGMTVGVADGGTTVFNDAAEFLSSGTDIPAGAGFDCTVAAEKFSAANNSTPASVMSSDGEKLHFDFKTSTAVTTNGRFEFTVVYRIYD